jgi:5-oxoprolinase (ATP-hydrolysing)
MTTTHHNAPGWNFWIDRGGTFTDVVARDPDGAVHVRKLLSVDPDRYADAPLHAIRGLMGLPADAPIPAGSVRAVKMGTTLATNALLERTGARVAFFVTKGFRDLLKIGYQDRPDLFALHIQKVETLEACTVEVEERILANGEIRTPLNWDAVRAELDLLRAEGIDSIAVLLINSYVNPIHEFRIGEIARERGFTQISLSHEVANEIKAVGRGSTTLADAYLTPIIRDYIARALSALGDGAPLRFMQSNGGLASAGRFSGKDAILSGPAGGVTACAAVCRQAGFPKAIGFDMGGTSTDVSRMDGSPEFIYEKQVAGVRIKAPMLWVETVAAGGGSILTFDGRRCTVGPESAGAQPGPACYGRGGPATVTDANLVLGRIQPRYFPKCFGPQADQPLDAGAAHERLSELARAMSEATGRSHTVQEVAAGFIRIANENMVKPIKAISVARGYDVQEYALCCFGGAGAQHACAVAEALGIRSIVIHPLAGVLSAFGMGLARFSHTETRPLLVPLDENAYARMTGSFRDMEGAAQAALAGDGVAEDQIHFTRSVELRYAGVDAAIDVPLQEGENLEESFLALHAQRYGFIKPDHGIEVVNARLLAESGTGNVPRSALLCPDPESAGVGDAAERPDVSLLVAERLPVAFEAGAGGVTVLETPVIRRGSLLPGHRLEGPAFIVEDASTVIVDPGWSATVDEFGNLILAASSATRTEGISTEAYPVMLEVFNNLFMSIAEQMGTCLERVSHSANIKERLDFSCALFGPDGALVANAPHIPVHLGAMGESVKAVLRDRGDAMKPGDVYLTNDPFHGGSHLPDMTVITPVFSSSGERIFFVANRGHHADIGGIAPGSMPPFSTSIDEEGISFHDFLLVSEGAFREAEVLEALSAGPWPARNLEERLSDLRAQIAANVLGVKLLEGLCAKYGTDVVQAYMHHVRKNAADTMGDCIAALPDGVHTFTERLDSGAAIQCAIAIDGRRAKVDFTGTAPQLEGNLNAPSAVVLSAVLYVFRTLVGKPIPLNSGCLDPIEVIIPEGSMLAPQPPAAVVGGNVETSQRICEALYGALGVLAGSQGTMNNLTFGNPHFGYYETIGGGTGAGPGFPGASGVHSHMTNTRITDLEVLERRYPVIIHAFSLRKGSGGAGQWPGGDGLVRAMEFREAVTVSCLMERRTTAAFGVQGGEKGQPGQNWLLSDEGPIMLEGHATFDVVPGDIVIIETPGGGGFGRKDES